MPKATVCASSQGVARGSPAANARTIGAQPVDCTATRRGSLSSTQPSSRSSCSALWMPISPTPPPVG